MKPAPFDTLRFVETIMSEFDIPEEKAKVSCALLRDSLTPASSEPSDGGEKYDACLRPPIGEDMRHRASMEGKPTEQIPLSTRSNELGPQGAEAESSVQNSPESAPAIAEASEQMPSNHEFPKDDTQDDLPNLSPPAQSVAVPLLSNSRLPPIDDVRLTINISRRHHRKIKLEALLNATTIGEMIEAWIDKEISG